MATSQIEQYIQVIKQRCLEALEEDRRHAYIDLIVPQATMETIVEYMESKAFEVKVLGGRTLVVGL